MKANELRLGSLIASSGNPSNIETWVIGKVVSISSLESQFEQIEVETEEEFTWFFKDNYFGIPLTEEWLIRFGFTGHDYKHLFFYEGFRYNLKTKTLSILRGCDKAGESQKDECGYPCLSDLIPCEFVHTLQNIIHSLTGKELEIK